MKRLRNIAVYYIVLGILCLCSFWLYGFWPLAIIGFILLCIYIFLRFVCGIKNIQFKTSKSKFFIWDIFLYLHPIILIVSILLYLTKPFKQVIVLPKDYEGVVVIKYDQTNGQPKLWIDNFLGFGGYRLIKVNKDGFAKTQFKYEDKYVPIMGTESGVTLEGMKIYYENDSNNEIPLFSRNNQNIEDDLLSKKIKRNLPIAFNYQNNHEKLVFVIGKGNDYNKYFFAPKKIKTGFDYSLLLSDSLKINYQEQIDKLLKQ